MRGVEVEDGQIAAYGVPEGRVVSYDEATDLFHDQCFDPEAVDFDPKRRRVRLAFDRTDTTPPSPGVRWILSVDGADGFEIEDGARAGAYVVNKILFDEKDGVVRITNVLPGRFAIRAREPVLRVSREAAPAQPAAVPSARKRTPQAEARRVAIPIAVVITAFLAFLMLTGILTDKSKAVHRDSTLELVLSVLTYIGFLAAIVWGVWSAFRGKGREWREARARSESARGRLAGQRARPREGGGTDELSPPDRDLSRYRHMKWYHGGPRDEDR
jgi:hypothetical protein